MSPTLTRREHGDQPLPLQTLCVSLSDPRRPVTNHNSRCASFLRRSDLVREITSSALDQRDLVRSRREVESDGRPCGGDTCKVGVIPVVR
jgi:hypothetical protein